MTLLTTVGWPNAPLMRRQRRLGAHLAALAFEAVEQRGFLAADIGAGADPDLDVEIVGRAGNAGAEHAVGAGDLDRAAENLDRVRVFGADVDKALGRADRDARRSPCLRSAQNGSPSIDHAVGKGAAVALVGVADDVFLRRRRVGAWCAI